MSKVRRATTDSHKKARLAASGSDDVTKRARAHSRVTRPADLRSWEQQPGESAQAYRAFCTFRDLGRNRTVAAAAAEPKKKHPSKLYRWSRQHDWWGRAYAWDLVEARQDEAVVRQQREGAIRQLTEDTSRMWRVGVAYLLSMVQRDPETGKPVFGPKFTPAVALRFCELALKVQTGLAGPPDRADSDQPADPSQLTNAELKEIIGLARELTEGKEPADEETHQQ